MIESPSKWHKWFSWSPTKVHGKWVWLKWIERRMIGENKTYIPHCLGLRHLGANRPDYKTETLWEYRHVR